MTDVFLWGACLTGWFIDVLLVAEQVTGGAL